MKKPAKRGTGGLAKPPPDDPDQSRRFEEAARELEAETKGKSFRRALDVVVRKPSTKKP